MGDQRLTGKFDGQHATPTDRPPLVQDDLARILARHQHRTPLPGCMPQTVREAVHWWIGLQEPPTPMDRPRQISVPGGEEMRWECPYHRRISATLVKFLTLSSDNQHLIAAAHEDGVFWRGDEMQFFFRVIDEAQRRRKIGSEPYRMDCMEKVKTILSKKAHGPHAPL